MDAAHSSLRAGMGWEIAFGPPAARARSLLEWALSCYRVDIKALVATAPDVIITQAQVAGPGGAGGGGEAAPGAECDGSSGGWRPPITLSDIRAALAEAFAASSAPARPPPTLLHLDPRTLDAVILDWGLVADAAGAGEAGRRLSASLRERLEGVRSAARGRGRRAVAVVDWMAPLYAAGAWVPSLVEIAGGRDLFAREGVDAPALTAAQLASSGAEFVIVTICGKSVDGAMGDAAALSKQMAAAARKSIGKGGVSGGAPPPLPRVVVMDGVKLFSRAGPSIVDSCEALLEVLFREAQCYGHHAAGLWRDFPPSAPASSSA